MTLTTSEIFESVVEIFTEYTTLRPDAFSDDTQIAALELERDEVTGIVEDINGEFEIRPKLSNKTFNDCGTLGGVVSYIENNLR